MTARKTKIIDPLLHKTRRLFLSGQEIALVKELGVFGAKNDIEELAGLILSESSHDTTIVVDLTPFLGLGPQRPWLELSRLYDNDVFFVVVVKREVALQQLPAFKDLATVIVEDDSTIIDTVVGKAARKLGTTEHEIGQHGQSFLDLRATWLDKELTSQAQQYAVALPGPRRYTRLLDDTWANMWIDIKGLFESPAVVYSLAYNLAYALTRGYRDALEADVVVVGNNNSFVLAWALNQIFADKTVTMIDRLGPFPRLSRFRLAELEALRQRRCCIIEDVVSTGRELDLVSALIMLHDGSVTNVACVFDLEIASSLLVPPSRIVSLCRPSKALRYRRLPKSKAPKARIKV